MKKTGFTLIELLAVIAILAIVLLIAVPNIISIIDNSKRETYNKDKELLKKVATLYLSNNPQLYPTVPGNSYFVKLSDLVSMGYISQVIDPKDKSDCDNNNSGTKVTYLSNGSYSFDAYLQCNSYKTDTYAPTLFYSISVGQVTINAQDEKAILFNADNQYTLTTGLTTNTTARTYVFEFESLISVSGYGRIFGGNPMHQPDIAVYNGKFSFYNGQLATSWVSSTVSMSPGRKIITYVENSNGTLKVYDGTTLISSTLYTANPLIAITSFTLGNRYDINNERVNGRIYEFQMWNKAFSDADVIANYDATLVGNETDLVTYYKFNEGSGTKVIDHSPSQKDATIYGATLTNDDSGVKEIRIKQGATLITSTTNSNLTYSLVAGTYTVEIEDKVGNIKIETIIMP